MRINYDSIYKLKSNVEFNQQLGFPTTVIDTAVLREVVESLDNYEKEISRLNEIIGTMDINLEKAVAQERVNVIKEYRDKASSRLCEAYRTDYAHWIDDVLYGVAKEMLVGTSTPVGVSEEDIDNMVEEILNNDN